MFFILLTFFAALSIEALGSIVSVIGISSLFGANTIIILLAIALDVGKVVVVSALYTHWKTLSILMKSYALMAAAVTMMITSGGAAGYLSGEFQKAMVGTQTNQLQVQTLQEQRTRYLERKNQIDQQIAQLPANAATARIRLQNSFKTEQTRLDQQIQQIDEQLPKLQTEQINTNAKVGPILQIAEFFNVTVEEATKWVILAIVFVFDPLAVFLIILGNFLWKKRKEERLARQREEDDDDFVPEDWGYAPVMPPDPEIKRTPIVTPAPEPEPQFVKELAPEPLVEPEPEPERKIDMPNWDFSKEEPAREVPVIEDVVIPEPEPPPLPKKRVRAGSGLTATITPHATIGDVKADPHTIVEGNGRSNFTPPKVRIRDDK